MKKHASFLSILALFLLAVPSLFAANPRLTIIATTFPIYDWTRQILGKQVEQVTLIQLQNSGADLHNFQPTVREIAQIGKCDLFIYVGGESDEWVAKALRASDNPRRITLSLMKELGNALREEKPLEGMEEHRHGEHKHHAEEHHAEHKHHAEEHHAEHKHHDKEHHAEHKHHDKEHHAENEHHDEHHHEHENDEHIWLSLRCAATLCNAIAARLSQLDPAHAAEYQTNCRLYTEKLQALDREYAKAVADAKQKYLLFADRFPFRYMADDYGLTCFAAFSGCSAESEASFKTIAFLAGKVDELKLPSVLVLESRTHKIAETVIRTAKRKEIRILVMDSLQSATSQDAAKGKTYRGSMKKNLEVLKQALDSKK